MKQLLALSTLIYCLSAVSAPTQVIYPNQPATSPSTHTPKMTAQLVWAAPTSNNIPKNVIVAAKNEKGPLYICQASEHDGLHPGVVSNKGCVVTYNGQSSLQSTYKILTGPGKIEWQPFNKLSQLTYGYNRPVAGVLPKGTSFEYIKSSSSPVIGGYEYPPNNLRNSRAQALRPLYICRVIYNNSIHLGKTVGISSNCNIAVADKEVVVANAQILFLKNSSYDWGGAPPAAPVLLRR